MNSTRSGLVILICLKAITALPQSTFSGLPIARTFLSADYKAGIQNSEMCQDWRGMLYVANNYGLLEFDGTNWRTYGVPNGTKVRSVSIGPRGRIYVGCQNDFGYFAPDERGLLVFTSLAEGLDSKHRDFDEVWKVYSDGEVVYFCTFSGIYLYHSNGNIQVVAPKTPLAISFLINHELFVNHEENGLMSLSENSLQPVTGGHHFAGTGISSMLPWHENEILISTFFDGIYLLRQGSVVPWRESMQSFFKQVVVTYMIRLRNGNLAIGTQNDGLLILNNDGKILLHMTRDRGLESRTILSLYEDPLNNLWVGLNNSITYVELGSAFTLINEQSGLPGTGYAAYLDGKTLYLGTNTGLYRKNPDASYQLIENTNGQVYHIGRYGNDLLVGHHNGAYRIEGDRAIPISTETGSWVFLQPRAHPNLLVEGTYNGLTLYKKNAQGHWQRSHKLTGFQESSRVMAEDRHGNLWVSHGYKGAFKINWSAAGDSITGVSHYGAGKGFPSNQLINVYNVGNELLFTSEQGIYRYIGQEDAFVQDPTFTTLFGEQVQLWSVHQDAMGNIYFTGRDQYGVLLPQSTGGYKVYSHDFKKIRKYLNDDLENVSILRNNEVLFGGKDGFIHYQPDRNSKREYPLQVILREISLINHRDSVISYASPRPDKMDETGKPAAGVSELPYRMNSVSFNYSATSYETDADIRYQFHLEPYDNGWSDGYPLTRKEYTNLKEGEYTFRVRAIDSNNRVSEEATFTFVIAPPWYRSLAAYSVYALATLITGFVGFSLLDRKYHKRHQLMEKEQQRQLSAKHNELEKLSQESELAITNLQNEKLEAELRHINSELANSTMHLLNKNEFISSIRTTLGQVLRKKDLEEVKSELTRISRNIDLNISTDEDWEHFRFHFDRVHGDFTSRFKLAFPALTPQEVKLSAYLRMNLSTKEIAQLLSISVRGVEISRYRLRKKLQLDRNQNLQDFILNF